MAFERRQRFGSGEPVIAQGIDEELRQHLDLLIDELVEEGWEPEAAQQEATRRFGDPVQHRAACEAISARQKRVEERRLHLDEWLRDLRYALRRMVRRPLFSAAVIATLALGVGATAAMFTVIHGVLLKPLPYPDADELAMLFQKDRLHPDLTAVSPPNFFDWRDQSNSFEALAAYGVIDVNLGTGLRPGGRPERLRAAPVTAEFFTVLGVEPALGRVFSAEEAEGDGRQAVLSHRQWQRLLDRREEALGSVLTLDEEPFTVVGVMPPGFEFPERETDLWIPSGLPRDRDAVAGSPYRAFRVMSVVGRLHADASIDAAVAEMRTLAAALEEEYPESNSGQEAVVISLLDHSVGRARPALLVLGGAVLLVLLLACANIANLLLVQAVGRQREMALRAAMGAGGWRLARQLAVEYLLFALLGGVCGALLGSALLKIILHLGGGAVPRSAAVAMDGTALLATLGISLLSGFFFGLAPILHSRRAGFAAALSSGARGSAGVGTRRMQRWLVVAEVAVALPLLVGGGLLSKSFARLQAVDPGFAVDQVWSFDVALPRRYGPGEWRPFWAELMTRLDAVPGVEVAAATLQAPLLGHDVDRTEITLEGRDRTPGEGFMARHHVVTPSYFEALRIPLLAGRSFGDQDIAGRPGTVIVNETMARRFWPGEEAVGQRLTHEMQLVPDEPTSREVVGVVADVRHFALATPAEAQIYLPYQQTPWFRMSILVRTPLDADAVARAARSVLQEIDPELPISGLEALPEALDASIGQPRFQRLLLVLFAATALLLAAVGLYGVMAYAVAERGREFGLRMAMGARAADLVRLILSGGLALAAAGLGLGLVLALASGRLLASQLFEVRSLDLSVYVAAVLLLAAVAFLATLIPARRALRIEPSEALRSE